MLQTTQSGSRRRVSVELIDTTKIYGDPSNPEHVAVDNMNLKIYQGEFFTFLGPSGCGKTTTLRMIAGFEEPTSGAVILGGKDVVGTPAFKRNTNTVFQSYALFPHLTVAQNIEFGLVVKGKMPKEERQAKVKNALEMVRMSHAADRKPSALSGGQQQRIALARALVNEPKVLLLDEPFGALDLKLRREMQLEIKEMQRRLGITFIFVTHDQEEALSMSDRIAVMSDGIIRQIDDPQSIYDAPKDRFTADFIGDMNLLNATVQHHDAEAVVVDVAGTELTLPASDQALQAGQDVTIAIRPEALHVGQKDADSATFEGVCSELVFVGADRLIRFTTVSGEVMQIKLRNLGDASAHIQKGASIKVHCPSSSIHLLTH